jgi:indole-3-glycerol phosphate synthase
MDFLTEIIQRKRERVETAKEIVPLDEMMRLAKVARVPTQTRALSSRLRNDQQIKIIAEFKRQSPSKGAINSSADPVKTTQAYESAGAAAVSILTEEDYFAGSLDDLRAARGAVRLPILRKDFIFEEYQVYETAAAGADALLLIVTALDDDALVGLRRLTEDDLGMDALVEVHTRDEFVRAINAGATLVGVNNRNLRTFKVSTATSVDLARLASAEVTLVSESGLNPDEVRKLSAIGYKGFLVGEALMRAEDPGAMVLRFREAREGANEA